MCSANAVKYMVSVKEKYSKNSLIDVDHWLDSISTGRSDSEMDFIRRSVETAQQAHAGQKRASGEAYFQHSLAVADILADLHMDYESIAAAILHDVAEDTEITSDQIRVQFGDNVARLVDGVTKMSLIEMFQQFPGDNEKEHLQAESLRKMLLAMAEDIRVVMIKLADRTHNMRTLSSLPEEKQKRIARETLDIYAPLANRLGIWHVKWELEDLSLRYLDPTLYKKIAGMVDGRRVDREKYIAHIVDLLTEELNKVGLKAEITGRPKHIYSIWRKMERKKLDYEQLYDIRGVRILVDEISECYTALGIVHSLWQYIPGEFDDYIATPKENNYQSIHTALIGPEGKITEIQIRTKEMHRHNELGVAAHWRYKEGKEQNRSFDEKINWMRQLLDWKDDVADASDFVDQIKSEVFQDRIYVFTPKGNVIDLPRGATALDFAYQIHTEVGHRCRGAKANGKMISLTSPLQTGQQIDILTVKQPAPSRDWLNPHQGYLKTSRARSKVQHWFRQQDHDINVDEGRNSLERELKRLGLGNVNFEKLADKLGYKSPDEMFVAIAHNEVKSGRYINAVQDILVPANDDSKDLLIPRRHKNKPDQRSSATVLGVGDLMTQMAHCCNPLPGDEISGYITRGRGVTIHRGDCPNILRYCKLSPERIVEVEWGKTLEETYPVNISIAAFDRQGLLRDITAVLSNNKVNLIGANTVSDKNDHLANIRLTIEVPNIESLNQVLSRIEQLPNIMEIKRVTQ